jgi:cobalt-zinc-cadmium efflux system outer membrane protein
MRGLATLSSNFFSNVHACLPRSYLAVLFLFLHFAPITLAAAPPSVVNPPKQNEKPLLLPNALNEGLIKNPRTSAIRLQLGITKSALIRATELPNPSIFMDNGYKAEFTYRYGVTIPIEPPWKLVLRVILAKKQIKQTDFEILRALWNFRAELRKAYTELIVAQELYQTLSELADLTEQLHKITQKRFEAGEVAELDVYRAEQEATKVEAQKQQQYYRLIEGQQALTVMLGNTPETAVVVPRLPPQGPAEQAVGILPVADPSFPTLAACLQQAMIYRPELKVVRQSIAANKANLRLAYGNVIPNPTIGVGSSVVNGPALPADAPPEDFGKNILHGFFFQVFQELPLLNVQQGDISQFRATARQLDAELAGQQNVVTFEVSTAYQRVLGAKRKFEIYQNKLLTRTTEIARLARLGYEVGQSDINAVLLAQQAAIEIKTEYLTTLAEYQQAFTDLERSIGTTLL